MAVAFLVLTVVRGELEVLPVLLCAIAVMGGALAAARRGYVTVAAYALAMLVIVAVIGGAIAHGSAGYAPFFLPLGVLVAAVALAPRDVLVVAAGALLGLGALAFWASAQTAVPTPAGVFTEGALLLVVASGLSLLTSASIARLVEGLRTRDADARHADERSDVLATELEKAQRMESLARLAGGVAHDFNNLLTVMRGCAGLLEEEVAPGSQAAADLKDLTDAVDRGAQLTRQLLSFSKRDVVQPVVQDLHGTLEGMRDILQRLVGPDVRLRIEVSDGPWPVWAALSQLEQVVMNLAVNARDAMQGKGEILLRVERVSDPKLGPACRLVVTDTGEGMSDEVKARLFEPFFTTKGPEKGTGLGLATVYGIVTRLGGRIEVESSPGQGAIFRVCLPIAAQPTGLASPVAPPTPATSSLTVCVVDDEAPLRNQMARILGSAGMTVRTFASAETLLAIGEHPCDVLVTDVNLPGMNGMRLAEKARARQPGLRVVLVSGFTADPTETARLVASGAVFLAKPFEPSALVDAALGESLARRPAVAIAASA